MAVDRDTLIRRLETICTSACAGDAEAIATVNQIKTAAAAGDSRAKMAMGALRQLYFHKEKDTASWDVAEAIYRETARDNPKAKLAVKLLAVHAKAGDSSASATLGRLKAIHASTKPDALFPAGPGQAKIGGYGMPQINLAGVRMAGPELIGAHTIPVRNRDGMVIGRRPVIVGGQLTPAQVADLRSLMEAAARARVLIQAAKTAMTRTTTTMGPSATQAAAVSTYRTRAVQQTVVNPTTSRYGTSYIANEGVDLRG